MSSTNSHLTLVELIDQGQLHQFHGGIHPPQRKERTNDKGIIDGPTCDTLFIPLAQHAGQPAISTVNKLDKVQAGQIIGQSDGFISANILAPANGSVVDITQYPASHASGLTTETMVLKVDNYEQNTLPTLSLDDDNDVLINRIKQSGITGLGGASFPTSVKLSPRNSVDVLIINGAECEPYITADDALMQVHSDQIVAGIKVMQKLLSPKRIVIGIEDNKPQAITAMENAVAEHNDIIVRTVPTLYPAGGEKQLIEVLTGQQVPSKKIPADMGIVVQNVATAYTIADAVFNGITLSSRIVTVSGDLVDRPGNYRVTLGTPIIELLEFCGFKSAAKQKIIMGGPMMGFALNDLSSPVIKSTNCIIAASNQELPDAPNEQNCIRCGDCEQVCPAQLLPQQLQWFAKDNDHEKLESHDLFDCIECGACAYVCPSHIPLVQYYRVAKADIRETKKEQELAQRAKERFELRAQRMERDKQERDEKNRLASERRKAALQNSNNNKDGDAVTSALARIKAKKAATQQDDNSPAEKSNDPVAAAIARAKAKRAAAAAAAAKSEPATNDVAQNSASNPDKDRVAAAIARAKAKKLAKEQQNQAPEKEPATEPLADKANEPSPADDKKTRIAATIAKAKAKKLAQEQQNEALEKEPAAEPLAEKANELSPADDKKARIAATIAKAKAKKLAQEQQNQAPEQEPAEPLAEQANELSPADDKKARIAATIAKAKAKKLAQEKANKEADTTQPITEQAPETPEPVSAEDAKKARIAAVIAKAKAKKLADQQTQLKDE